VVLAPKGPDKIAQGNALGTRKTTKNEGKSPEGAQHPTGDVSPFQGSVEGLATGHPGRCPGLICGGPFGANEFSATPKSAIERNPGPRLRFLMLRELVRSGPNGAKHISPGHRPGDGNPSAGSDRFRPPCKGGTIAARAKAMGKCRPYRARRKGEFPLAAHLPRALPWATLFCPFRAPSNRATSKSVSDGAKHQPEAKVLMLREFVRSGPNGAKYISARGIALRRFIG
jgi:hypothetical protein